MRLCHPVRLRSLLEVLPRTTNSRRFDDVNHMLTRHSPVAAPPRRYFGFFGTLFLPIDIAEAYWNMYLVTANVTVRSGGGSGGPVLQNRWQP